MRIERPGDLPGALSEAVKANKPVILEVISDIEAMADRP
jgi:hypothetical protein